MSDSDRQNDEQIEEKTPAEWRDFDLDPRLRSALDGMSLARPTAVQARAVPALLAGGDWEITAHPGSGKTLAYLLPALQRLLANEPRENPYRQPRPRLLVLAPTRELTAQIFGVARSLIDATPLHAALITGGEDFGQQKKRLKRNPEIVVATPGRLLEHLEKESTDLGHLDILVLDEADRILDMGFRDDVLAIARACNDDRQSVMLSATLYRKGLGGIRCELLNRPRNIVVNTVREKNESIEHRIVLADDLDHKMRLAAALLTQREYGKALVFVNTRQHAEVLANALRKLQKQPSPFGGSGSAPSPLRERAGERVKNGGLPPLPNPRLWLPASPYLLHPCSRLPGGERAYTAPSRENGLRVALLHGEIPHDERKRVLKLLSEGRVQALVSTDVAARGLDIRGVDLVVNFDLPRSSDDYAHRSGRTGRAGNEGVTISLIGPRDWNLMLSIQRYLGLRFGQDRIDGLEARFAGPKKRKKSGKAVGRKKNKKAKQRKREAASAAPKPKKRLRDRKNIGKRRKPSTKATDDPQT